MLGISRGKSSGLDKSITLKKLSLICGRDIFRLMGDGLLPHACQIIRCVVFLF